MSKLDELKAKWVKGGKASELEFVLIMGQPHYSATTLEAAATELARLQAIEQALKINPSIRLINQKTGNKLYWADDTQQWEVYSTLADGRPHWSYKGDDITAALVALDAKP